MICQSPTRSSLPGRQQRDLLVRGKDAERRRPEQAQHREIDLAMAAVRRRVDEPGLPVLVRQDIAAPQVSVPARGWLGRSAEVIEAAGEPVELLQRPARQRAAIGGHPGKRLKPVRGVELRQSPSGALGRVSGPSSTSRSPPNDGAPAACRAGSPRPSCSSVRAPDTPRSIHSSEEARTRRVVGDRETRATGSTCASDSQRRPSASRVKAPGAASWRSRRRRAAFVTSRAAKRHADGQERTRRCGAHGWAL